MTAFKQSLPVRLTCQGVIDENLHGRFRRIISAIPSGARVLDVACGSGTLLLELQRNGCECVGLDLAPGAVQLSRLKGLNVHEGNADAFELEPRVGEILLDRYDVVIFSKCLMYLRNKNALMRRLSTRTIFIHQANPNYWKALLGQIKTGNVGPYLTADGKEIQIRSPGALIKWGESYGYCGRRLVGGWLRGRDMVIQFVRE